MAETAIDIPVSALEEQAKESPYKSLLLRMLKNPLATEKANQDRNSLADWARRKRQVTGKKMTAVLSGSAAYGFTPRDADVVVFAETDNDYVLRPSSDEIRTEILDVLRPTVPVVDLAAGTIDEIGVLIKEMSSETIEILSQTSASQRGAERHSPTGIQGVRPIYLIAKLFGPTSKIDEEEGMVDEWRTKLLKTITARPDAEQIWKLVQQDWRYIFVDYEKQPG